MYTFISDFVEIKLSEIHIRIYFVELRILNKPQVTEVQQVEIIIN